MLELTASLGLMYILKYGSILSSFRYFISEYFDWGKKLFSCSLCLGFWTGIIISLILDKSSKDLAIFSLASAAWCWSIDSLHDVISSYKQ